MRSNMHQIYMEFADKERPHHLFNKKNTAATTIFLCRIMEFRMVASIRQLGTAAR